MNNNYKAPQPNKNPLPPVFSRTQSAPPEGKEEALNALLSKVPNLASQQPVAQLANSKKLTLKSSEFRQTTASTSTGQQPPVEKEVLEANVMKNIEKFNQKQTAQTASLTNTAPAYQPQAQGPPKKKLNPSASSFTIPNQPKESVPVNEWDKALPKQPITPQGGSLPGKTLSNVKKPVAPAGKVEKKAEDEKRVLEKIEEEKKEDEVLAKERALEKERLEKEHLEKERLEKERLEKERLEKERLEKERLEKERLEKERLDKERLEKEQMEKERLEKEEKERLEKERLEKEAEEKARAEKERLEAEEREKERKEAEEKAKATQNHGFSVVQKTQTKITKQYLIDLIEAGRKLNPPVPEYLKLICNREVIIDSFSQQGRRSGAPGKKPMMSKGGDKTASAGPTETMVLGSGRESKTHQSEAFSHGPQIMRNAVDPKAQALKDKANQWVIGIKDGSKENPLKLLENEIRSNLNKLTPDNFLLIREKILEIGRKSRENIDIIVQKIIEKAWVEPKYIETYAQLCSYMQNDKSLVFEEKTTEGSSKKNKNNAFKSKLLERIQKAFENEEVTDQKDKEKFEKMSQEDKESWRKRKMNKILGNVKFIGELYLNKVIPQKVIHICACSMFEKFQKDYFNAIAESDSASDEFEYNLEGIIKLFDRVGHLYDKDPKKETLNEEKQLIEQFKGQLDDLHRKKIADYTPIFSKSDSLTTNGIFQLLDFVKTNLKLPTKKISTLIDNLIDRRENGWRERLLAKEGPKKIKDLHDEYFKEIEEIEKRHENDDPYDNRYQGGRGGTVVYYEKKGGNMGGKGQKPAPKPVFEVYSEKTEKIEEEKREFDTGKKVKLDFSMDRSKTAGKSILKDSKLSRAEVEASVKSIFKKLSEKRDDEKEGDYNEKNAYDDLLSLSLKANHSDVFARFFHDYYDAAPLEVNLRVILPYKLVTEGGMKKEDFFKEFGLSLSKMWSNVCDFPHLLSSMAKILFEFMKGDMVKLSDVEIDWTGGGDKVSEETTEEIQFVLKDFVEQICKILKEKGMFEKKEDEIKGFLPKIKVDDIMPWYEKMKKRLS